MGLFTHTFHFSLQDSTPVPRSQAWPRDLASEMREVAVRHSQVGTCVDRVPFTTSLLSGLTTAGGGSRRRHGAGPPQSTAHGLGARSNLYGEPLCRASICYHSETGHPGCCTSPLGTQTPPIPHPPPRAPAGSVPVSSRVSNLELMAT